MVGNQIDVCLSIRINLANEILNGHVFEGVYALSVEVNGKPSYIKGLQGWR